MAQLTLQRAFELALEHHQAGRLREAEQLYRQILTHQPNHAGAMHYLGVAAGQAGRKDLAVDLIRQAIALHPNYAVAHSNLGNALRDKGLVDEAIAAYRHALVLNPNLTEAHSNLGNSLKDKGQLDEAIAAYRRAIALNPAFLGAHNNLGSALKDKGLLDEAIAAYRQALVLSPDLPEAHSNLGDALRNKGQFDQAIAACRQAIALRPNFPEAHFNLGVALNDAGQLEQAIAAYRQAIALRPGDAQVHFNLGVALYDTEQLDQAIAAYHQAIATRPNFPQAHSNLGNALKDIGQLDQAIVAYRQAIAIDPDDMSFDSNLVLVLHYHSTIAARTIAEEHGRWDRQHAQPLRKFITAHGNDRSPERRLRIGYVSPDLKDHVVGRFLLPLLEHHDHRHFEVFCYSNVLRPDAITARLRSSADQWREIAKLNDEQAARKIRADGIDILVDLAGHTAGNRLLVFARRPAPVQVSYLGYPGSTGVSEIDYRLTDGYADPPHLIDSSDAKRVHRLPRTNWCLAERENSPPVEPSPMIRRGHMTFGSFNSFAKVTDAMLQVWARILHEIPGSRLLLKAAAFGSPSACERVRLNFAAQGIDANRLTLSRPQPHYATHLALYGDMDIALDTFPYHGTTTTCDALWMGVPVITLAGQTHVSRVGVSLLSNIGLPELVATTTDEYVSIAAALARDQDRLITLRGSLRERMRRSPLMDAGGFARDVEAAYRQMWRAWCQSDSDRS